MEKKKVALILGMAAVLLTTIALAVTNTQKQGMGCHWFGGPKFGNVEKLGLPENTTREEIRDAFWKKRLEDIGLTENSTIKEFREAMKENMETKRSERLITIKEKLGLPENATQEEVKEALKNWREENGELFSGKK